MGKDDNWNPIYSALSVGRSTTLPENSARVSMCSMTEAKDAARILMGFFVDFGKVDPDIYTRGVIEIFMNYPEAAVRMVVDPVRGLPSKHKWLPTIAEIKEALEDHVDPGRKYRLPPSPWPDLMSEPSSALQLTAPEPKVLETTVEHRKEVVEQELGYNPNDKPKAEWADRKKWKYDPAKAHHYPLEWLMLTKEERWERQAKGEAPIAAGPDHDKQQFWSKILDGQD